VGPASLAPSASLALNTPPPFISLEPASPVSPEPVLPDPVSVGPGGWLHLQLTALQMPV
jgi:hypothetical protein